MNGGFKLQPNPIPNDNAHIANLVALDIMERKALGMVRYGTPLQAYNGRNALQDAYEEALDLAQYLRQLIEETNKTPQQLNLSLKEKDNACCANECKSR